MNLNDFIFTYKLYLHFLLVEIKFKSTLYEMSWHIVPQKMHFAYRNLMFHHRIWLLKNSKDFAQVYFLIREIPPFEEDKLRLGFGIWVVRLLGCWGFGGWGFGLLGCWEIGKLGS